MTPLQLVLGRPNFFDPFFEGDVTGMIVILVGAVVFVVGAVWWERRKRRRRGAD